MDLVLLQQGLTVLCLGFAVVFAFLSVMIFAMGIMGRVIGYLNEVFPPQVTSAVPVKKTANEDEEIAVAIAAVYAR